MDPPRPAPCIGIDLVEVERLRERLERRPELADELFHPGELAYANAQHAPLEHLAARFAAKEAVVKALGIDGFEPLHIEVVSGGEACTVRLHDDAAARVAELNAVVTVSLTHLAATAGAVALVQIRA